ncbi:MAG: ABC transporter permease, partial [Halobacteriota archaeon]
FIAVWQLTTLLTLISFVGERTSGTLLRLLASPLKESELVAGYAAAFGVIGMTQSAVLLAVAVVLFNVTIVGDVLLAFVVIALLAVVSGGSAYHSRASRAERHRLYSSCPSSFSLHLSSLAFFGPYKQYRRGCDRCRISFRQSMPSKRRARSSCARGESIRYTLTLSRFSSLRQSFSLWRRSHCAEESDSKSI